MNKRHLSYRPPHDYCAPAKRHLFHGRWMTVAEISKATGIPNRTVRGRIARGLPADRRRQWGPVPKRYLFRGQRLTIREIMSVTGMSKSGVHKRISGETVLEGEALKDPCREPRYNACMIFHRGESRCIARWSAHLGMNESTLRQRLKRGWTMDRIVSEPVQHRFRNIGVVKRIVRHFNASPTGGYVATSPNP